MLMDTVLVDTSAPLPAAAIVPMDSHASPCRDGVSDVSAVVGANIKTDGRDHGCVFCACGDGWADTSCCSPSSTGSGTGAGGGGTGLSPAAALS